MHVYIHAAVSQSATLSVLPGLKCKALSAHRWAEEPLVDGAMPLVALQ